MDWFENKMQNILIVYTETLHFFFFFFKRHTFIFSPEDKCSVACYHLKLKLTYTGHISDERC